MGIVAWGLAGESSSIKTEDDTNLTTLEWSRL